MVIKRCNCSRIDGGEGQEATRVWLVKQMVAIDMENQWNYVKPQRRAIPNGSRRCTRNESAHEITGQPFAVEAGRVF